MAALNPNQPQQAAVTANKDAGPEELKLGEYFLHVFVEETASLDVGEQKDAEVAVKLEAFGKSKLTKSLKNITSDSQAYFGEHYFFDKIFHVRDQLESQDLVVSIVAKGLLSNKLLGSIAMNISAIYFEPDRTIRHKWFILQDRTGDFQKVKGYVKMSISLSADKDPKVELAPETFDPNIQSMKDVVEIPPSIRLQTNQLSIRIIRGENLPKLDNIGAGIDAFLEVSLGTVKMKTKISKNLNPFWNEEIYMPLMVPNFLNNLKMAAWDYDTLKSNDPVGSMNFKLSDIKTGKHKNPNWVHIYGAPEGSASKEVAYMQEFPQTGTSYRGSVLLTMEIVENPQETKSGVFISKQSTDFPSRMNNYIIVADFRSLFNLRADKGSNFEIKVCCGKNIVSTGNLVSNVM